MCENIFSDLSDDIIFSILHKLEEDPRDLARIACVSTRFSSLITTVCFKSKCLQSIRTVVSDLLPYGGEPPGGWASLYKLAVCCPGLLHSGVLLENSGENHTDESSSSPERIAFFDEDLRFDPMYMYNYSEPEEITVVRKKRKVCRSIGSHLASRVWNLSRDQGSKLLASRFEGDCLYVCYWPGCVHVGEKRNYMLFRGVFKNFTESRVWRAISESDGSRGKVDWSCEFCSSKQIWDLHSSFCLKRYFGYHDDGDQVVRAYVCENGHVSGAWTDCSLYI